MVRAFASVVNKGLEAQMCFKKWNQLFLYIDDSVNGLTRRQLSTAAFGFIVISIGI
jgi:hypothetical protein